MNIFLFLMLIGNSFYYANTQSINIAEYEQKRMENSSTGELKARVLELESLLRKKNRLIELKNEQILSLKADISSKSE